MHPQIEPIIRFIAVALQTFSVLVLGAAVLVSSVWFVVQGFRVHDWREAFDSYRANLGRGILLGLELLVGADIIATVTEPLSFERVGPLAAIVLIRTFLSFALETEIQGRWPWRRADADPGESTR